MAKIENADQYIEKHQQWGKELKTLRSFLLTFPFEETIKWGGPVYMYKGKNVVGLAGFKYHYALWLYQGTALRVNTKLLHNAQEGNTKSLRQIRFSEETDLNLPALKPYIEETIKAINEGTVPGKKEIPQEEITLPPEFEELFQNKPEMKLAFEQLSPGKQREYVAYIQEAKRAETKENRISKILPLINEGKGLNDKYKNKRGSFTAPF